MTQFTTTKLAGGQVLIEGTDRRGATGEQVVDGREWAEINGTDVHSEAHAAFEAAVEEFFKPLTDAAEALEEAHKVQPDDLFFVVKGEDVDAVQAEAKEIIALSNDSVILRAIEVAPERLIWVDKKLVVTEPVATEAPAETPVFDQV